MAAELRPTSLSAPAKFQPPRSDHGLSATLTSPKMRALNIARPSDAGCSAREASQRGFLQSIDQPAPVAQTPAAYQPAPAARCHCAVAVMLAAGSHRFRELKSLVERFQKVPQMPMSMHPGAEQGIPFELSPAYQRLRSRPAFNVRSIVSSWLKEGTKPKWIANHQEAADGRCLARAKDS